MPGKTLALAPVLVLALAPIAAAPQPTFTYTPRIEAALDRVSADSLRGHVSFLASDLLEGRYTPSRGLDIAAEYIAAQFRRAGLEPAGGDGYYQDARFLRGGLRPDTFELVWKHGPKTVAASGPASLHAPATLDLSGAPAMTVALEGGAPLPEAAAAAGKVLFAELPVRVRGETRRRIEALRALQPALLVTFSHEDPESRPLVDAGDRSAPWLTIHDEALAAPVRANPVGATVSLRLAASGESPITLRNVVGVLRGSDPALRDTALLVTAHYDHIGVQAGCTAGDCIYNGANDDASGVASVIEIAHALAALHPRPRRSIVFMALFGEERGILGSRYYVRHPVFPLAKTVANLNLEQLGRTDSGDGPQVGTATFTGFDFSTLPKTFQAAGTLTGIRVHNSGASNTYFASSDNIAFAEAGIPAHTACVAYEYPDYHGVADHWDKLDYPNMARVNRMLALGALMLADDPAAPRWNESNRAAAPYAAGRAASR